MHAFVCVCVCVCVLFEQCILCILYAHGELELQAAASAPAQTAARDQERAVFQEALQEAAGHVPELRADINSEVGHKARKDASIRFSWKANGTES